jgi:hypothetical protein
MIVFLKVVRSDEEQVVGAIIAWVRGFCRVRGNRMGYK